MEDWVRGADVEPCEIIKFEGGLYAAAISIDGDDDINGRVYEGIKKWLKPANLSFDERPGHRTLCQMVNPTDEIGAALGYHQLDIYVTN